MKRKKHRKFTDDFKRAAVARLNSGESQAAISEDLDIGNSLLYVWRAKLGKQVAANSRSPASNGRAKSNGASKDAIVYLRHARTAMIHQVVGGQSKLEDPVYLFALLALNTLEGERA